MRITYEAIEKWIGALALLCFALSFLGPSWRSAMSDIFAGIGFVLIARGSAISTLAGPHGHDDSVPP